MGDIVANSKKRNGESDQFCYM